MLDETAARGYILGMSGEHVLQVRNLRVDYRRGRALTHAVRGVELDVFAGESLGIIGESGCGKSSLGKSVLGLVPSTADELRLFGIATSGLSSDGWTRVRRRAQMVFQDVGGALSPRMRVGDAVTEGLIVHGMIDGSEKRRDKAAEVLHLVGLDGGVARRFPHELSGGQRQRVLIARALALDPDFVVADEPIASLDVSVQTQILALLDEIRRDRPFTLMFITHDIRAVKALCTRVAVMYEGRFVEQGPTAEVLRDPADPYTRLLIDSVPSLDPLAEKHRLS
ncbi:MAG: ABC transporter ATP-binding protein [Deltaproteobacteria bacterium]|nr:ABC transporter ATP-binding protein [Deltaproteobacteria bacterium]